MQKPRYRGEAPKTFVASVPHRRRSRRHRGRVEKFLGRLRFERRDVLVVAALLLVLFALLLTRFSDRLFDSFSGKPPSATVSPEGGMPEPGQ